MKKMFSLTFVILISWYSRAQTVTAIVSNNGIAPIPAFSLNQPAAMVFLKTNITKNLEFSPDITFDLRNGKGWFADTWIRWNQSLDTLNKWIATVGFDWSFFFQSYGTNGDAITQTVRYPTYQAKLKFNQSKKNTFIFDYWYTYPATSEKQYGVKGSYVSLMYSRTQEYKKFTIGGNLNIFYISYSDGSKGFGSSYDGYVSHNKSGLFLGAQLIHSLSPQSSTNMKLNWNVSLGITRKLF